MLSDAELREPLGRWLAGRWPASRKLEVDEFQSPKSGWSARTIFVPVRGERGGRPFEETLVFRLESPEPAIYPPQAPGLVVRLHVHVGEQQRHRRHQLRERRVVRGEAEVAQGEVRVRGGQVRALVERGRAPARGPPLAHGGSSRS